MITDEVIPMMPMFGPEAKSILEGLLDKDPEKRLGSGLTGIEEIKQHEFFIGCDWEKFAAK